MTSKRTRSYQGGRSAKRSKKSYVRGTSYSTTYTRARFAVPPKKVELKYDDGISSSTVPTAGTLIQITSIANGTGPSDRIGRSIVYNNLNINWNIKNLVVAGPIETNGRVIIFYDKQSNGAFPTVNTVMNGTDPLALYNPDNRSRFTILYDKKFNYQADVSGLGYFNKTGTMHVNENISLKGKGCHFQGTTNAITDIESGCLYFMLLSDVNNGWQFNERNRLQFFD